MLKMHLFYSSKIFKRGCLIPPSRSKKNQEIQELPISDPLKAKV